jgi:hypothetical protein
MSKSKILYSEKGFSKFRRIFGDTVLHRILYKSEDASKRSLRYWRVNYKSYINEYYRAI